MARAGDWFPVASLDLADRLLLAAVAFLPWAFGGIEIWAYRLAGFLIVLAAAVRVSAGRGPSWELRRVRGVLVPSLLFLGLALFQLLPLPPSVLAVLSPRAHDIHASTFPGYVEGQAPGAIADLEALALSRVPEVEGVADPRGDTASLSSEVGGRWTGWRAISLVPAFTLERVGWFVPLLIAFFLFHAGARDEARRRVFEAVLFIDFLALALFGLVFAAAGNGKLYWIRATVQEANPFGPYVNPTNFAAVMELAVPWLIASAWAARRLKRKAALPFPMLLASGACCALAGILAGSRAGMVLIGLSIAAIAVLGQQRRALRWALGAAFTGIAVIAASLVAFSGPSGRLGRVLGSSAAAGQEVERFSGWRAAWEMLGDFPLTGAGIGAFRDVFPIYAPAGGYARMTHLHNDYLEVVVESGWPGAVLLAWLVLAFGCYAVRATGRSLRARGLLIGLACLFAHAWVDFNHQIPANALLFVAAAGILVARERQR